MLKIIWLILIIAFIWVEAETVAMVSLWFAFGSLAALIVESTGGGLGFQIGVFAVVSAVLLLLLRPITRRYFTPKLEKTNIDAVIGKTGMVTGAINNDLSQGQVNGYDRFCGNQGVTRADQIHATVRGKGDLIGVLTEGQLCLCKLKGKLGEVLIIQADLGAICRALRGQIR